MSFNRYFQDELSHLRTLGKEFGEEFPALAPMLAESGTDPEVERLLEGFAFLTAKLREKLDDHFPELLESVGRSLCPSLTHSLPSATIIEHRITSGLRNDRYVDAGAQYKSTANDGLSCLFTSVWPMELRPIELQNCEAKIDASGHPSLQFKLASTQGVFVGTAPSSLRVYLAGSRANASSLRLQLLNHLEKIVVTSFDAEELQLQQYTLPGTAIKAVGFQKSETLFAQSPEEDNPFAILADYFTLPQKFNFLDIVGLDKATPTGTGCAYLKIQFIFQRDSELPIVDARSLRLHCVPAINLFETTTDPVRFDIQKERFLLRVAGLTRKQAKVQRLLAVEGLSNNSNQRWAIPQFLALPARQSKASSDLFYTTHITSVADGGEPDIAISIRGDAQNKRLFELNLLSISILATNGSAANQLRVGEINRATPTSPVSTTFENITPPSPYVACSLSSELQWRILSHLSLNLKKLETAATLRETFECYDYCGLVDSRIKSANQHRITGITDLSTQPYTLIHRGSAVHGLISEVELDESHFETLGDLALFGAIIDQCFANLAPINGFQKTRVTTIPSKKVFEWPAKNASHCLS